MNFVDCIVSTAAYLDDFADFTGVLWHASMDKTLDELEVSLFRMSQPEGPITFEKANSQTFLREKVVNAELATDGNFLDCLDKPVLRFLLLKGDGSGPIYPPLYVPRLKMLDLARAALESGCCRDEIEMDFGDRDEEDLQSPWLSLMGQAFSAQRTFILKSGVISLFLKHGANPNATCRGVEVWERFLRLALNTSIYPDTQAAYLRALDDFIATGKLPHLKELKSRGKSFFVGLAAYKPLRDVAKTRLLEGVLERLVPLLQPIGRDEQYIWDSIRTAFSSAMYEGLVLRHHRAVGEQQARVYISHW